MGPVSAMTTRSRSESQPFQGLDLAAQIFDCVVVDHDAMGLQESVHLVAGTETKKPLQFGFRQVTALVFFERATRQIPACRHADAPAAWFRIFQNSGNDTDAASALSIVDSPSPRSAATANAIAMR